MHPIRILFFLVPMLFCASLALADRGVASRPGVLHLNLESAVRMSLSQNFAIRVERVLPAISRERANAELGRFDPNFTLSGGRGLNTIDNIFAGGERLPAFGKLQTDNAGISLGGLLPSGTTYNLGFATLATSGTATQDRTDFSTAAQLAITQPLLRNFGTDATLQRLRVARNSALISEWALRKQVSDTITQLVYVYNDLHAAQENLRVAQQSRRLAEQTLEDNTRRAEIGVMSPLDITTARAEVAAREEGVILAKRSVLDNQNLLKQVVTDELEPMLQIQVEIEPPLMEQVDTNVRNGIIEGLKWRPDYRQGILDLQQRHIILAFVKNQALPQLDLTGSLNLIGFDGDFAGSVSRLSSSDQTTWTAGAIFSIPLGNRAARSNVDAAKLDAARALIQLQRLEQQIVLDVDNSAGQIVSNRARITSTSEAHRLAIESLSAGEQRLRAGTGTTFEVLELQNKLTSAEYAELRARSDYNKAVAEFYRQTGTVLQAHGVSVD